MAALLLGAGPVVLLAALITAVAWPIPNLAAAPGVDRSWQIGLHMAATSSLRHGADLVFTYGPLGFLSAPWPPVGPTSLLALLATVAVFFGLVLTMLYEARRLLPFWAAALVTLLVARMFSALPPPEAFQLLLFVLAVEAVAGRLPLGVAATIVGAGVLAGVAAMGKLDVGITAGVAGAALAAAIVTRWWRGLAAYAVVAAAATVAIWLATGQPLTDLGPFTVGAYQLVAGFSESMGIEHSRAGLWTYPAVLVLIVVLSGIAWRSSATWPRRRRVALAVIWGTYAFAAWKITSVREHPYAFPALAVALFPLTATVDAVPRLEVDRRTWLMAFAAVWLASAAAIGLNLDRYLDLRVSVRWIAREFRDTVPWRLDRTEQRTQRQLAARYQLPADVEAAVAGRRVHIDPWETGVAYAYPAIRWQPLPIFQSYSAYTPYLDELNASRLRAADAPERILRHANFWEDPPDWLRAERSKPVTPNEQIPRVIDGRFRWFESPAAMLETFCRYSEVVASGNWQVLAATGRSCGTPEALGTVVARDGQTVDVPSEPRPDRFVVVRVHGLDPSPAERLMATLYKGTEWYVTLSDGVRYRLVSATAADGLLLAVPRAADGTGVFTFGPPIGTIAIQARLTSRRTTRQITYEFLSIPLQR